MNQGWSMFSMGASKIANTAKDNVSRYGNIAGQKVRSKHIIVWPSFFLFDLNCCCYFL